MKAEEILHYPVDELYHYRHPSLCSFSAEPYAALFEDFINEVKPSVVIVGGTVVGRSLAPRVAARFRTGLTADCTMLDISAAGGLEQIRPAFGGNIMAHIRTPDFRPQFATVRYKIFDAPRRSETRGGRLIVREVPNERLRSGYRVIESRKKPEVFGIEDAQVIIAVGRGLKKKSDLELVEDLASALKAQIAGTRPMIESGLLDPRRQIGLSGRTVKPALILTLGVSGSVQFVAGMKSSDRIIAVNTDRSAPIFNVAHIGIVGDLYEIVPTLLTLVKERGKQDAV
jgi:electron transfer flavoprotein alpha subunit